MSQKKRKIGEGAMAAYGRQGLAEVRAALYPDGGAAQPTDPGMWGVRTHGEIADERRGRNQGGERGQEPDAREQDRESARDKLLAKYDSRVHEERAAGRDSGQRAQEGPSMERE